MYIGLHNPDGHHCNSDYSDNGDCVGKLRWLDGRAVAATDVGGADVTLAANGGAPCGRIREEEGGGGVTCRLDFRVKCILTQSIPSIQTGVSPSYWEWKGRGTLRTKIIYCTI